MRVRPSGPLVSRLTPASGLVAVAVSQTTICKRPQLGTCDRSVGAYIQEGFATGTLSDAEFTECMELAFAPAVQHTEPLVTKLKRAILSADASPLRTFTAVGAGSSVTAGNQLDRSLTYEELERRASTFVNRTRFW